MKALMIILIIIFSCCSGLLGQNTADEEVIANAQRFLQKRGDNLKSAKSLVLTKSLENKTNKNQLFIHNVGNKEGWIITEKIGDRLFVLGYSLTGSFDYEKSAPYVQKWLSLNLDSVSLTNPTKAAINSKKDYYRQEPFLNTKEGEPIQWNQWPIYNDKCPVIDEQKTPTGCGPTAIAQIMRYWEFPYKGKGEIDYQYTLFAENGDLNISLQKSLAQNEYNWDKMPCSLNDSTMSEEKNEVSELLYDVGLSLGTRYDKNGSAITSDAINKFYGYFNYKKPKKISLYEADGNTRKSGKDSLDFLQTIIDNLDKKYPVLVIGYVWGGFHVMVCDGYDNEGFFHVNYGWGGQSDGYYHYSDSIWCGMINQPITHFLFVDAFIDLIPSEIKYSAAVVDFRPVTQPGKMDSICIQIEEDDRSCPFYFTPKIKFEDANGLPIETDITYSIDTAKSIITINYQTPGDEGVYDLMVSLKTKKDVISIDTLTLTINNQNEAQSRDIQISSVKTTNDFGYDAPSITVDLELQNTSIQSECKVKSELISNDGAIEYSKEHIVNLTGDSTQIKIEIPMQEVSFGNKQLTIKVDSDNLISETDETNNRLDIPVMFNREIPMGEWQFLKDFYINCNGENWKFKENWMSDQPVFSWRGVTANEGHIVEITNSFNVVDNAASGLLFGHTEYNTFGGGVLPDNISNLKNLEIIDFANSEFGGTSIPPSITELTSLKQLQFYHCGLSGPIPTDIGKLQNLEELIIDENHLTGVLPPSVFNLEKLKVLRLSMNQRLEGNIDSIGKLQNLTFVQFGRTSIGGRFPADVFNLPYLQEFGASDFFYGPVPVVERTNETLLAFGLRNSQLEGNILTTLSHCKNLRNIELMSNKLMTGDIPASFFDLKDLFGVEMRGNSFTGTISGIGNLKNLRWFNVNDNKLSGTIPSEISELKGIWDLDLSGNNFTVLEPLIRDSLHELRLFNVQNNKLQFESLENNQVFLKDSFFNYNPQKEVGEKLFFQPLIGESFTQSFSCSGNGNVYQWFCKGTAFGGPSSSGDLVIEEITENSSGEYFCEITNPQFSNLKLTSAPINLTVTTPVGKSDLNNSKLTLYPNPLTIHQKLSITGLKAIWSKYQIIDMLGKVAFQGILNLHDNDSVKEIDISFLRKGVYFIQFENNIEAVTKKFIVI